MNKQRVKEIGLYLVFGVLTTLVSWGSYTLFVNLLSLSVFVSNLLSWVLAVIFAYITNKLWVFNSKSWAPKVIGKEIVTFLASRGITGVLEIVSVPLLEKLGYDGIFFNILRALNIDIKLLFTDGIYSKITVSVIVVILNYVFSKLIVFRKKEK
jgi:putative flippase GtrA